MNLAEHRLADDLADRRRKPGLGCRDGGTPRLLMRGRHPRAWDTACQKKHHRQRGQTTVHVRLFCRATETRLVESFPAGSASRKSSHTRSAPATASTSRYACRWTPHRLCQGQSAWVAALKRTWVEPGFPERVVRLDQRDMRVRLHRSEAYSEHGKYDRGASLTCRSTPASRTRSLPETHAGPAAVRTPRLAFGGRFLRH